MPNKDISYLLAKLEELHEDVRELKLHVDTLRQEQSGRKAVVRFLLAAMGIVGATVGWLVDNVISMAKHINFN